MSCKNYETDHPGYIICRNCGEREEEHTSTPEAGEGNIHSCNQGVIESLQREVERLKKELEQVKGCDHLDGPYRRLLEERDGLKKQLEEARLEVEEQCRLNGMGASREAKLIAQLEQAEKRHAEEMAKRSKRIAELESAIREMVYDPRTAEENRKMKEEIRFEKGMAEQLEKELAQTKAALEAANTCAEMNGNNLVATREELFKTKAALEQANKWESETHLRWAKADRENEELKAALAEVREWLCDSCNTVYPGPPQKGFMCVQCPKCSGDTAPKEVVLRRRAERKCEVLESALAEKETLIKSLQETAFNLRKHVQDIDGDKIELEEKCATLKAALKTFSDDHSEGKK